METHPYFVSLLLKLDQYASTVLGVQENHRLAVSADFRLVAQHPHAWYRSGGSDGDGWHAI